MGAWGWWAWDAVLGAFGKGVGNHIGAGDPVASPGPGLPAPWGALFTLGLWPLSVRWTLGGGGRRARGLSPGPTPRPQQQIACFLLPQLGLGKLVDTCFRHWKMSLSLASAFFECILDPSAVLWGWRPSPSTSFGGLRWPLSPGSLFLCPVATPHLDSPNLSSAPASFPQGLLLCALIIPSFLSSLPTSPDFSESPF